MSSPDPEIARRALALLDAALEVPPDAREDWVRERTADEPDLRRELQRLLAAHERRGVLDGGAAAPRAEEAREDGILPRLEKALGHAYRIVGELGRGGMAVVFLAWEKKHDRQVVLKVLKPGIAARYGAERFQREVRLAGRLSHPHILGLIDSGSADGLLYYVMPYVEGETLGRRLEKRGPLPVPEAVALLRDVADALAYAHEAGVVHRDLKPENVLCAGIHAFLMDFGVAKPLMEGEDEGLTHTGVAVGTPRYMAPEQAAGWSPVDHRVDLYAWGQIAHEVLTGSVRTVDAQDVAARRGWKTVAAELREAREDVPPPLAELVGRCLAIQPHARLDSASDLARALRTEGGAVRPQTFPRARGGWIAGLVAAVVVVAVVVGLWIRRGGDPGASPMVGPVAVAGFTNQTGDDSLEVLGSLAGDWLTQGLQETGLVSVVPWPTALRATEGARNARQAGEPVEIAGFVARETGARIVVTGTFYRSGDQLRFQVEVTEPGSSRIVTKPAPILVHPDSAEAAIRELRERVMGSLAVVADSHLWGIPGIRRKPPTFEAYRAFHRALELYLEQDYEGATDLFLRAHHLDTTFVASLLYAATTAHNQGSRELADSLLSFLADRREGLGEFEDLRWRYLTAVLESDGEGALRAARRASEMAPNSRASYNLAMTAVSLNRPREALAVLQATDPDVGELRGWAQYWTQLAHAYHLLGRFEDEARTAREMRERHPERRIALVLEVRALAARGLEEAVDARLEAAGALSPRTYWSQGAAMTVAGEEFLAHGHEEAAERFLARAERWLRDQLEFEPGDTGLRYWLGSALYDARRFDEAREVFEALARERPTATNRGMAAVAAAWTGDPEAARAWLAEGFEGALGDRTAYRARVAAIEGDRDRALTLLSEAFRTGVGSGFAWIHASGHHDLALLADSPRYRRLLAGPEASEAVSE